jgi:hypothetical protein
MTPAAIGGAGERHAALDPDLAIAVDGTRIKLLDYPDPPLPGMPPGPNDRQAIAHRRAPYCDELLFGGARGGGKTDFAIAEALRRCSLVDGLQAVIFRRTYPELMRGASSIGGRLLARMPRSVARWQAGPKEWRFRNGSVLSLSYLETLADVQAWLGLEIQLMVFDQLEQLEEETYLLVRSSLRAAGDLGQRMAAAGYRPSSIATANPGGAGHAWVKQRFVDPFPDGRGQLFRAAPTEDEPTPMVRCFVKSLLSDNPALDKGDPSYRAKLEALGHDERKAYLEGDWNVFKGARFGNFRTDLHVVAPEDLPIPGGAGITRARGIDWGSEQPFVCLWGARLADDLVVVYREVYGPGLSSAEQAALIRASETDEEAGPGRPIPAALDPQCWASSPDDPSPPRMRGGVGHARELPPRGSIAWHYQRAGLPVRRADNRRVEGAAAVADRLKPRPDGTVRLKIYSTCTELIRTLPALQRDPRRPEDVLKCSIDHWYDALRYLLGELGLMPPTNPDLTPPPGPSRPSTPPGLVGPSGVARPPELRAPRGPSRRGIRKAGF